VNRISINDLTSEQLDELYTRAEQVEELLRIAEETSNRSDTERARAVQRAEQAEAAARSYAALGHMSETDVQRVIDLYEQWVKAGPPPLGTSISRWWDARLVELHDAILPAAHETGGQS
jgi:hypothetical protein